MATMATMPGTPEYVKANIHGATKKDNPAILDISKINLDAKVEETNI